MSPRKISLWVLTSALLLAGDYFGRGNFFDGLPYLLLVLLGFLSGRQEIVLLLTAVASIGAFSGQFFHATPGLDASFNDRMMTFLMLILSAGWALSRLDSIKRLLTTRFNLEEHVERRTQELKASNALLEKDRRIIKLNKNIAAFANQDHPVEDAMRYGIEQVCKETGWPVGHVFFPDEYFNRMIPSGIWYLNDPARFETFRKVTEETYLLRGVGLPGRVLETGRPTWIIDVNKDSNFPRAVLAQNIGVRAGFAFPVLIGNSVAGVMEFYSTDAVPPDPQLLEIMGNVGTQLGRVMERKNAQQEQSRLLHSLGERIKELKCLYEVTNLLRVSNLQSTMFQKICSFIVDAWQYPEVTRVRIKFDGSEYTPGKFRPTEWKQSSPIVVNGVPRGSLEVYYTRKKPPLYEGPFSKEERFLINGLALLLSESIERLEAEEERERSRIKLRELYHRLEEVREEERKGIAREVHDELGQVLTTLKLELSLMDRKLSHQNLNFHEDTEFMLSMIDDTIQTVKRISSDLRPPVLDDLGLQDAIEWQGMEFEKRTNIKFRFNNAAPLLELDLDRSITLFRIFQEALTNVIRHAEASEIRVDLQAKNGTIMLNIEDNGKGITTQEVKDPKSLGLLGMQERALVWGGHVDFISKPNKGTIVNIEIRNIDT